jgi:hypothetical protein
MSYTSYVNTFFKQFYEYSEMAGDVYDDILTGVRFFNNYIRSRPSKHLEKRRRIHTKINAIISLMKHILLVKAFPTYKPFFLGARDSFLRLLQ